MTNKDEILKDIFSQLENYTKQEYNFTFDPRNPVVRLHEPSFGADEIYAATETMLSTYVTMGKKVRSFEEEYAKEFGFKHGIMNNSGSSANLLAIAALTNPVTKNRLKPGDEVLVPALSWATTVWPLIQHQLVPVFVDCDLATYNFDYNKLEAAITPKTRAIMLVHVYGNPCDMDAIMSIAKKHNLLVIEDCCEAMGAYFDNKAVGGFGEVGTFSFYYSHHITTLEGGICVTNNFELTELLRVLRAHGWSREADEKDKYIKQYPDIDPRFIFINIGYNLRPTEVQAAMGAVQLPKLKGFVEKRRETAAFYRKAFAKYSEFFDFQQDTPKSYNSFFGFGFVLKNNLPFTPRDITSYLQKHGIETRPIIAGNMARHPALKMFEHKVSGTLENCDKIMKQGFAIGCHHAIDQAAREYVANILDNFMKSQGLKTAA